TLHTEGGFVLAFQRVGDYQPPRGRDLVLPQQFRVDLEVKDLDQAQADVLDLGATLLDDGDAKRGWRIFADPAGHPFCLVRR
ncbi:VOC family protein, partial [Streptomyces sp. NPDC002130]|uniref:VOC family protein n=1 Tax=Streptomyces sp. NPDC002130 TaxID=3155568 RepID=UPI00331ED71B